MEQYNIFSKIIHWVTALLILGLLAVGFYMTGLESGDFKFTLFALHKSFGLLVLGLACVRVIWHVVKRKPKPLSSHKKSERALSHMAHILLYAALFAIPLSGWIMSSAGDYSTRFFGIDMPDLVQKDKSLFENAEELHEIFALILVFVLGLHILGAFKHHFIDCDATLSRITIPSLGLIGGAVIAFLVIAMYVPAGFYAASEIQEELFEKKDHDEHEEDDDEDDDEKSHAINGADKLFVADITQWQVDLQKSKVQFKAVQQGHGFKGYFNIHDGQIFFDEAKLDQSKVRIEIDISSVETGSTDRDEQAVSEDWFDTARFPVAVFETNAFKKLDATHFVVGGKLTLRGKTLPIKLPFTLDITEYPENKKSAIMTSTLELNRLDFEVGQGKWASTEAIDDMVKLEIMVYAYTQ